MFPTEKDLLKYKGSSTPIADYYFDRRNWLNSDLYKEAQEERISRLENQILEIKEKLEKLGQV